VGAEEGGWKQFIIIRIHKSLWNCHNESTLYNKYILIKKIEKKNLQAYPKLDGSVNVEKTENEKMTWSQRGESCLPAPGK
jgi:hypothetical protein